MPRSVVTTIVSVIAAAVFSMTPGPMHANDPDALTVHEWGTFTSIAGPDGAAVEWHPLGGPSDLPCFVERSAFNIKGALAGTVRMETPVLYFYAPRETVVDVRVRFPSGVITEWFPHASVVQIGAPAASGSTSAIAWSRVTVSPAGAHDFPVEPTASHYYTARETNAAAVRFGSQTEKFLFYRGVGRFALPIAADVDAAGHVSIRKQGPGRVDEIILFSNDRGRLRYEVRRAVDGVVTVDQRATDSEPAFDLQRMLVANGLFPEEALAMVESWRDSWFEEGTRLFYVVPRRVIDSVLPVEINPPPDDIARVFVARTELVTPAEESEIARALLSNDFAALGKYGRFLEAIGRRIIAQASETDRMRLGQRLQGVYSALMTSRDRCAGRGRVP